MQCIPCGKTFTGQVCYDDHMRSAKHKKKVTSFSIFNRDTPSSSEDTIIVDLKHRVNRCDVCDIIFNSHESFKTHSLTREHAEKVLSGNMENGLSSNVVSSNSELPSKESISHKSAENVILCGFEENRRPHPITYATCNVCNKCFSGFEPHKQHLESAQHLKKMQMQEGASALPSTFSCEPCNKVFSGQVPYTMHMGSEIHKKKMQQLEFNKTWSSEGDTSSKIQVEGGNLKTDNNLPWFCNICNVQCSGFVPYQQHLSGAAHLKKKLQNITTSSVNSVHQGENISGGNNMETDDILPDLERRLNAMSTDELKEIIKIFLPDENVDFDKANVV